MVIWERFTTKKIVVNGKEKLESRCEVWKYKWNTKWNILCVKIVALISFTILIAFILHKNLTSPYEETQTRFQYQTKQLYPNKQCIYQNCTEYGIQNSCCFTCINFDIDANAIDEIIGKRPEYHQNKCIDKLVLTLENCRYPNNKLANNWSPIPISQLIINGNIEDIEDGAFNSQTLKNLIRITLKFPTIPYYRKNMFRGLSNLQWLEIQDSIPITSFENNVMKYIAKTVHTLQISHSNLQDSTNIENLTSVYMPNLLVIDLQFNMLESLPSNAFHNAPSLVAVYLTKNLLSTLHETNFVSNIGTISIKDNSWICSCELYWLQKIQYLIDVNDAKCLDGKQWKNFDSIFKMDCENFSPTTEITISEIPSSSSTVSSEESSVTVPHEESSSVTIPHEESSSVTIPHEESSSVTTPHEELSTTTEETEEEISSTLSKAIPSTTPTEKETDDGMWIPDEEKNTCRKNMVNELNVFQRNGKLVVQFPNANKNAKYFFFHSENIKDCNKLSFSQGQAEGNFEPNTSYTFCEVSSTDGRMQCLSGRTLPLYEDQTWMTNQNKIPVILIGVFVNLFSIIFSSVVTYICLRKHSSLIRKNNEQSNFVMASKPIYLTSQRPHIFSSRIGNEELTLRRHAPSVPAREHSVAYVPVREASYFSPVSEHYMYVRQKPTLHRSVSDLSLKTVASYVTDNQIMSWRKRSKKERAPVTKLFDEPPPLPPPRNRCDVIVHENEILSQSSRQYW